MLDAAALADHVAATMSAAAGGSPSRPASTCASSTWVAASGSRTRRTTESLDLVRLRRGPRRARRDLGGRPDHSRDARLLLEPGRFLVGPAGAYVARVVDRKTVDGSTVVILDGGIHHVLRPALVGQEHRVGPSAGRAARGPPRPVTVAGPLCSGLDVFSQHAIMAPPDVGDLVAVLDVGAYGFTESMPLFLSHPIPAEVAIRGGRAALIRPRQEPGEWLDRQLLVEP